MNLSELRIISSLENYLKKIKKADEDYLIRDIHPLTKGWETELYAFKLIINKKTREAENLILRIYPYENSHAKTKHEFEVLKLLHEANYPVPKVYYLELDDSILGYPFIIMERILGVDMGEIFTQALKMNDQKTIHDEILPIFTQLFVQLHNLNWKIMSDKTEYKNNGDEYYFINQALMKFEKRIIKNEMIEFIPLLNWLKEHKEKGKLEKISILHKDFHPHNIILDKNRNAFVVDWPGAYIGDYREDLGWTLMLTESYISTEIANEVLKLYETISKRKTKEIEYFIILATAIRLYEVTMILKKGSEALGLRKEARDQIEETKFHIERILLSLNKKIGLSIESIKDMLGKTDQV